MSSLPRAPRYVRRDGDIVRCGGEDHGALCELRFGDIVDGVIYIDGGYTLPTIRDHVYAPYGVTFQPGFQASLGSRGIVFQLGSNALKNARNAAREGWLRRFVAQPKGNPRCYQILNNVEIECPVHGQQIVSPPALGLRDLSRALRGSAFRLLAERPKRT